MIIIISNAPVSSIKLVSSRGYAVQEQHVTTADGYVLTLHRIPCVEPTRGRPVLLMHAFLTSSADWVTNPPYQGLGFFLSDLGYDVWMGNFRGNSYSRKHTKLRARDSEFWNFSLDEMAKFDLPATIDHVLKTTQCPSLVYIGFSMGSTVAFALLSTQGLRYKDKVSLFIAMGPVTTLSHTNYFIKYLPPLAPAFWYLMKLLGVHCLLAHSQLLTRLLNYLPELFLQRPTNLLCAVNGADSSQYYIEEINSHIPAGSSAKNFIHFAQIMGTGCFRHFDYGKEENLKNYGEKQPPEYSLERIQVPVVLIWSLNDYIADPVDVALLKKRLGSTVIGDICVDNPTWGHLDFIWSPQAAKMVYGHIRQALDNLDPTQS